MPRPICSWPASRRCLSSANFLSKASGISVEGLLPKIEQSDVSAPFKAQSTALMQLRQPSPNLLGRVAPQPEAWRPEDFSGSLSLRRKELAHVDEEIIWQ